MLYNIIMETQKEKHNRIKNANIKTNGHHNGDPVACPLCDLTSKLNVICTSHRKSKHPELTKTEYIKLIRTYNGRPPKQCSICNEDTIIPKGESEYPSKHYDCYMKNRPLGDKNPTWKGGKSGYICPECNSGFKKYNSQTSTQHRNNFCSYTCLGKFYSKAENKSEAQKNAHKSNISKPEKRAIDCLRNRYPDIISHVHEGRFIYDAYIPSINVFIEVHGNYWHCKGVAQEKDIRKLDFILNNENYKNTKLRVIWEHEVISSTDIQLENILDTKAVIQSAHTHIPTYRVWAISPTDSGRKYKHISIDDTIDRFNYIKYLEQVS